MYRVNHLVGLSLPQTYIWRAGGPLLHFCPDKMDELSQWEVLPDQMSHPVMQTKIPNSADLNSFFILAIPRLKSHSFKTQAAAPNSLEFHVRIQLRLGQNSRDIPKEHFLFQKQRQRTTQFRWNWGESAWKRKELCTYDICTEGDRRCWPNFDQKKGGCMNLYLEEGGRSKISKILKT